MSVRPKPRYRKPRFTDTGDLTAPLAQYIQSLQAAGHTRFTVSGYAGAARHFIHWLALSAIAVTEIDVETVHRFARHRCACGRLKRKGCLSVQYMPRVHRFAAFLGAQEIGRYRLRSKRNGCDARLAPYRQWLLEQRGLRPTTIDLQCGLLNRDLPALGARPRAWTSRQIREVVVNRAQEVSPHHASLVGAALRGYLRFLGAQSACRVGLEHAVPSIPKWNLSTLPRYIGAAEIERLISTCDTATQTGLRDRAVLLLLARLGLRAGDIVSLRLGDIDWRQSTIAVQGKSRSATRLPLPQDAGDALLAYLVKGRPRIDSDRAFFMAKAPVRPMVRSGAVGAIVRSALRKSGVVAPMGGAHLLRHSAATAMLRGGATLQLVGSVLRHRSPDMTAHYAKVDVTALQRVTQTWLGDR